MDVRNAEVNPRQARDYFIESVIHLKEVFGMLSEQPEWLPVLERLVVMKEF